MLWKLVYQPKKQGGLGLKSLSDWNITAIGKLYESLFLENKSLWANKIKGQNFWDLQIKGTDSQIWKGLLRFREKFFFHFIFRIKNGEKNIILIGPLDPEYPSM